MTFAVGFVGKVERRPHPRQVRRAEALDQRWRDQLLEHKDAWSAIIRTAHETRLADPRDDDARGVSEQIVRQDGPTV